MSARCVLRTVVDHNYSTCDVQVFVLIKPNQDKHHGRLIANELCIHMIMYTIHSYVLTSNPNISVA
jgi:hypothetical protein